MRWNFLSARVQACCGPASELEIDGRDVVVHVSVDGAALLRFRHRLHARKSMNTSGPVGSLNVNVDFSTPVTCVGMLTRAKSSIIQSVASPCMP